MARRTLTKPQSEQACAAFVVHRTLLLAELADASLRDNPFWTMLRQDAYERFCAALDGRPIHG